MSKLAQHLELHRDAILARWESQVAADTGLATATRDELRTRIPGYVRAMASALRRAASRGGRLPEGAAATEETAREPYRGAFSVETLVRQYGALRDVILDLIEETGCAISPAEVRVLTTFISTAIADGVSDHARQQAGAEQATAETHVHELLERERKLYALFTQTPLAICILEGPRHVFSFANPAFAALVGGRELADKPLVLALPELERQGFGAVLDGVFATGEPFHREEVSLRLPHRAEDEALALDFTYTAKRDAAGVVDGVIVFAIDVTEKVNARQRSELLAVKLLSSEDQLRRVVEASGTGTWELDLLTEAVTADARHRSLLGLPKDEPLRLAEVMDALHEEDRERVARAVAAAAAGEQRGSFLVEARTRANGTQPPRWFEARGHALLHSNGRRVRLIGTSVDISARKLSELELEHARSLEIGLQRDAARANEVKDQLLALLGHELRNPIAPIMSALALIRERGGEHNTKEFAVIERQAGHLVRLLDDLLDISRITSGKVELKKERVELADVVMKAVELAMPIIEHRRHALVVEVASQGLAIDADPGRMAQVFAGLLRNAAQFTEPGGKITLTAEQSGGELVVRVIDTGVGIAADMIPAVFEMFVQARQGSDRARGGLGLGLAIVQSLVSLHGGSVRARSDGPGRGSEFIVSLPVAAPVELAVRASSRGLPKQPAAATEARRILIVDDNEDAAELLALTLQMKGHTTRIAVDGHDALDVVGAFAPDLALLDIGLPGMDGYELARQLRARGALSALRLVALTGYGQDKDRERSREAGFDAHLVKPVDQKLLESTIRELTSPS